MTALLAILATAVPLGRLGIATSLLILLYGLTRLKIFTWDARRIGGMLVASAALVSSASHVSWSYSTARIVLLGFALALLPEIAESIARGLGRENLRSLLSVGSGLFALFAITSNLSISTFASAGTYGRSGSHNWVGAICTLGFFTVMSEGWKFRHSRLVRIILATALLLSIGEAYSWVAAVGLASGLLASALRRLTGSPRIALGAGVSFGMAITTGIAILPRRIAELVHFGPFTLWNASLAAQARLEIFADGAAHVLTRPLLGYGTFSTTAVHSQEKTLGYLLTMPSHFHDGPLQLAIGYGLVAAIGLLLSLTAVSVQPQSTPASSIGAIVAYIVMDGLDLLSIGPVNILVFLFLIVAATAAPDGTQGASNRDGHRRWHRLPLTFAIIVGVSTTSVFIRRQHPPAIGVATLIAPLTQAAQEDNYAFARISQETTQETLIFLYCDAVCHIAPKGITRPAAASGSQSWFGKVGFTNLPPGSYRILLVAVSGDGPHAWSQVEELADQKLTVLAHAP